MKKNNLLKILVLVVVVLVLLFVLSRCSSNKQEDTTVKEEPVVQETVKEETPVVEEKPTVEETAPVEVVEEVTEEEKVDVTTLSYWVNFINPDGSLISRKAYKYGSTPAAPVNPTYEDGVIYYNFLEWDKKVSPVYGTQTYKALYEKTGYVHKDHDDESTPNVDQDSNTLVYMYHTSACYSGYLATDYIEFDLSNYTQEQINNVITMKDLFDLFGVGSGDIYGKFTQGGNEKEIRINRQDLSDYHIPGVEGIQYAAFGKENEDVYGYEIYLGTDSTGPIENWNSLTDDTPISDIYFSGKDELIG